MLGNFTYCNPTKLYFGEQSLEGLHKELPKYGGPGGPHLRRGLHQAQRYL